LVMVYYFCGQNYTQILQKNTIYQPLYSYSMILVFAHINNTSLLFNSAFSRENFHIEKEKQYIGMDLNHHPQGLYFLGLYHLSYLCILHLNY
jgi:hypothetical protein